MNIFVDTNTVENVRQLLQKEMGEKGTLAVKVKSGDGWTAHVRERYASAVEDSPRTVAEALLEVQAKAADPNRKPLSLYFGILSPDTYGDGLAYQQKLRDEWD